MNKRYRLLKDLPDGSKNGDVYEQVSSTNKYYNTRLYQEAKCIDEGQRWESWQVENNLSWFELIKEEPERSRIVFLPDNTRNALFARHGDKNGENDDKFEYAYVVYSKTLIPEDKHSLIQKAIEEVLNEVQRYERFSSKGLIVESPISPTRWAIEEIDDKRYTKKELLEAEEKAFQAARMCWPPYEIKGDVFLSSDEPFTKPFSFKLKFDSFSDYKSHNQ